MPQATLHKPPPSQSAKSTTSKAGSKRSSFSGLKSGSSSASGTLFRSSPDTTSNGGGGGTTSRNLRSFFKGSTLTSHGGSEGGDSPARSRTTSTETTSTKTSAGSPVKSRFDMLLHSTTTVAQSDEQPRKRRTSLLERPFSTSASSSTTTTTTGDSGKKAPTMAALKTTTAPPAISTALSPPSPQLQVSLPYSTTHPSLEANKRYTAPHLHDGTLSSPALHLASDALSNLDYAPVLIGSSSSIEALVSPPRSRSSTVNTVRPSAPETPTPKTTPRPRPAAATSGSRALDSPIQLDYGARTRTTTAPGSPTPLTRSTTSPESTPTALPNPRKTHQRSTSHPVSPTRQTVRSAVSFLLKETTRYLPKEMRERRETGWAECESRMGGLKRAERNWGGVGTLGGEAKERKVVGDALADGVVLCFVLNRLFSTTLQPPLRPSLRPDARSASLNVDQFLSALTSLGLPPTDLFPPEALLVPSESADGLVKVSQTIIALAKMEFDPIAGGSSMKRSGSTTPGSSPTNSRPGSPSSRPNSPNKVAFVLPSGHTGKRRSMPSTSTTMRDGGVMSEPVFIPPYNSLRRVTPPSPLRGEAGSINRKNRERSMSPTGSRQRHFSASGPLTPPIEDALSLEEYLLQQKTPTNSPLSAYTRPRTPSLDATHRDSTDSAFSFSSTVVDGVNGSGGLDVTVGSASTDSGHGPLSGTAQSDRTVKTDLEEEVVGPKTKNRTDVVELGRGQPSGSFGHSNASTGSLPSILRPPPPPPPPRTTSPPPLSPAGLRSAARRVSPSSNLRPSTSLRRAGSAAAASSSSTLSNSTTSTLAPSSPKRHVPRRGMSVDMAGGSTLSMASLVAEAMAAEMVVPHPALTPSGSENSELGELVKIDDLPPRPLRRNSSSASTSGGGKSYIVRARSLKRSKSPPPLNSSQLVGSAIDSAPCTPSPSSIVTGERPLSPPQADPRLRRPEFSTRPTPVAHDAYAKPSTIRSRSTHFAEGVEGHSDAHEDRRRRHSAVSHRPSFGQFRSENGLEDGRGGWRSAGGGGGLSRDSSSTSLAKGAGSGHRELLTVREEGRPTVIYAVGNCIGKGQFGSVYRALNLATGEMVAIKRIRLEGLGEDEIAQLMKEVELVKRLSHASIVKYEGMMRDENTLNIVLEYVENGSLGSTLKAFGKFNERLVSSYVIKILEGLDYLHSQKVVHCDLKAANILTTKVGNIKLTDFGVSLSLVAVEQKKENDVAGTPNWMAPEVIQMEGASTASDIWSLGCVIIELMTGRPPFAELSNSMAVMYRIVEGGPPPMPEGASEPLKAFLSQCFEMDPSMRPSAEVLFEHVWLQEYLAECKTHKLRHVESIPFLQRKSTEFEIQRVRRSFSTSLGHPSAHPSQTTEEDNDSETLYVPPGIDIPGRQSAGNHGAGTMSLPASFNATSAFPVAMDDFVPRPHTFVKSTFSKPVLCRVCQLHVKKSAVLCEGCTLICHSTCVKAAPETCDLGAQLMLTAQRHSQSQQQLYSSSSAFPFPSTSTLPTDPNPSSTDLPSSSILSSSPIPWAISERFLAGLKRSRSPTPRLDGGGGGVRDPSPAGGGLKRFGFPSSSSGDRPPSRSEKERDRPGSSLSNYRPVSRQSRLSRISRGAISRAPSSHTADEDRPASPSGQTEVMSVSQVLDLPEGLTESPSSTPGVGRTTFDVAAAGGGGVSRISTRSEGYGARSRRKESKDCVIS